MATLGNACLLLEEGGSMEENMGGTYRHQVPLWRRLNRWREMEEEEEALSGGEHV